MKVDEKATRAAQNRQATGILRLRKAFGWTQIKALASSIQNGRGIPYRRKPGVPVLRDAYHQKKHRSRKNARQSRKRNR